MQLPVFESVPWEENFQTISLDVAAPYLGRMGLTLPEGFMEGLRSHLADLRRREIECIGSLDVIPSLVQWLKSNHGIQFVEYLQLWGEAIFRLGGDGTSASMWSAITRWPYRPEHPQPPPAFVCRLYEVQSQIPELSIYNQGPVSDWDRMVYKWREETDYINPMELVQGALDDYDFRRAWMLTSREMPDLRHMTEVKAWGLPAAQRMDMPLEYLGDPGSWPQLPPPWAPA